MINEFDTILERPDGSYILIEPYLQIQDVDREAFEWTYEIYRCEPGDEKFIEVTEQYLELGLHVTAQEIFAAQTSMWEMLRPTL